MNSQSLFHKSLVLRYFLIFLIFSLLSQYIYCQIYEIGLGIDNKPSMPISGHWTKGRAQINQSILRPAAIGGTTDLLQAKFLPSDAPGTGMQAKPITELGWNIIGSNTSITGTLLVYLKNVAKIYPLLETMDTWGNATAGATLFFSGTVTTPSIPGWWMIETNQSVPFTYNGGSLIVITSFTSYQSQAAVNVYTTSNPVTCSGSDCNIIIDGNGNTVFNFSNFPTPQSYEIFSNGYSGNVPNMRFGFGQSCNPPDAPTGDSPQTFCKSATVASIRALGNDIKWYLDESGGSALPKETILKDNTIYYGSQTIDACESNLRLPVLIKLLQPSAPEGSPIQTFCNIATVKDLFVTGESISWYSEASGGSPLSFNTLCIDNNHYFATQTIDRCESSQRLEVTVKISKTDPPQGQFVQNFCNSAIISDLNVQGENINWFLSETDLVKLNINYVLENDSFYYASQTKEACESERRLKVQVNIKSILPPEGILEQMFCNAAKVSDLQAEGEQIQWYLTETDKNPLSPAMPLTNNTHYYASQTIDECESSLRLAVFTIIKTTETPIGSDKQTFCNIATIDDLEVTGELVKWYKEKDDKDPIIKGMTLEDSSYYYASQTIDGCESLLRKELFIIINKPAAPLIDNNQLFCNMAFISDIKTTGFNVKWYETASGGMELAQGTMLINNKTYFASQIIDACESVERTLITALIKKSPLIIKQSESDTICLQSDKILNINISGSEPIFYQWYKNNIQIQDATDSQYSILNTQNSDKGLYNCVITNICEEQGIKSDTIDINIYEDLFISNTLKDLKLCANTDLLLSVEAKGYNVKYQWYKDNIKLDAFTNALCSINNIQKSDSGYYYCIISNQCNQDGLKSISAFIQVYDSIKIENKIENISLCKGDSVEINIKATGTDNQYQWYKEETPIFGATDSFYKLRNADFQDENYYFCNVYNECNKVESNHFSVFIMQKPIINIATLLQNKLIGDSVKYSLAPSGVGPFNYQWLKDNQIIIDATDFKFDLYISDISDAGSYSCVISNKCGSVQVDVSIIKVLSYSIDGVVSYNNIHSTVLSEISLELYNSENIKIDSTITDKGGYFKFNNLLNGIYRIDCKTKQKADAVDPIDALYINRQFLGMYKIKGTLPLLCADVNNDNIINPIDALYILRRYIKLINKFHKPDWLFEKITVNLKDVNQSLIIKAICTGDVDASYK